MTVSRNGFYRWLQATHLQKVSSDAERDAHALACWKASRGSLGSRTLSVVLRKEGFNLGRYATRSLMKRLGLSGRQRRHRYVVARDINVAMPNHLDREFTVEAPNKKWVTDITYIQTRQGWCYLAAVVDLYSRKVVGWDVAKTMTAELALRALRLAKLLRQPKGKVLVHSDQGSQYTSSEWRDYAKDNGVELSQSRRGNCWDNAVMERFFGSLKSEWVKERCYPDAESAKRDISKYVIEYYNMWRPHTHLGGLSPNEYEVAA
ncbi:IS3 family transposase [Budvicia aquatica]|nr:IS3 family transposase [Budvicia aquatica]PHI29062.1 IS3 family transposase [Budvicia aquatica]